MEEGKRREGAGGMGLFYNHNESSDNIARSNFLLACLLNGKITVVKQTFNATYTTVEGWGGHDDVLSFKS